MKKEEETKLQKRKKNTSSERLYNLDDDMLILQQKTTMKIKGLVEVIGGEPHDLKELWTECNNERKKMDDEAEIIRKALKKFGNQKRKNERWEKAIE